MPPSHTFNLLLPRAELASRLRRLLDPPLLADWQTGARLRSAGTGEANPDLPEPWKFLGGWRLRWRNGLPYWRSLDRIFEPEHALDILDQAAREGLRVLPTLLGPSLRPNAHLNRQLHIDLNFRDDVLLPPGGVKQELTLSFDLEGQRVYGDPETDALIEVHLPWSGMVSAAHPGDALPALFLLRAVVELLEPLCGWDGMYSIAAESTEYRREDSSDLTALPDVVRHDPAPWLAPLHALVLGPDLRARLGLLPDNELVAFPGLYSAWRDGHMVWLADPRAFGVHRRRLYEQVVGADGPWTFQYEDPWLERLLDRATREHETAVRMLLGIEG